MVFGNNYIEYGEAQYIKKQEEWERKKLMKLAEKYNFKVVQNA